MALKVLGQKEIDGSSNAVDTDITLYTTSGVSAIISKFTALVRDANATIRVNILPNGGSVADANYYIYDAVLTGDGMPLEGGEGLTLEDGASVVVRSNVVDVNFMLFGEEK